MYKLILETDDFLVFDKEDDLPCIRQGESPGLSDEIILEYPYLSSLPDFGFTHRLDNETRGIVLLAKNLRYYDMMRAMFSRKEVKRTYHARVVGRVKEDEGIIDLPIAHMKKNPRKMVAVKEGYRIYRGKARAAETRWKVLTRRQDSSDIELETCTGIRHQIRVHLSSMGHPVCGDELYGASFLNYPSLMLISKKIEYKCPLSGEDMGLVSGLTLDKYKLG